jgi:hypothetical protein
VAEKTESGIKVILSDYPYAEDGLLIWNALATYFTDYLKLYYSDTGEGDKPKVPTLRPQCNSLYCCQLKG